MIHHVSIPAREPRHVAEVLAELMNGKCLPFRPLEGDFGALWRLRQHTGADFFEQRAPEYLRATKSRKLGWA